MGRRTRIRRARRLSQIELRLRLLSAGRRVLPHFVIAGAQKGGTSSLYAYLAQHPAVAPSRKKEVHFFDRHFANGERWYRASFPTHRQMAQRSRAAGCPAITGESSPSYLFHPLVPERMAAVLPDARIVVLLREPVSRAFSHWRMSRSRGEDSLPFADALAAENERVAGELERVRSDAAYFSLPLKRFTYFARGLYADQLERWFAAFPREQILVLQAERFFEAPEPVVQHVQDHLGLPRRPLEDARIHNPGKGDGVLDPDVRARLAERYAPENERLFALLGERYDWNEPA